MKIGISFVGISHGIGRDCQHCFSNTNQFLIEPFKDDNDVKTFVSTYKSDIEDFILTSYKPTSYQFLDFSNSHQTLMYAKSLEQMRGQDLDFVISTRFDIHFKQIIKDINLDYNKFNALFREKAWWDMPWRFTTDNFFAFPYNMLEDFIIVLNGLYTNPSRPGQTDLHQAFFRMQDKVGADKTHIVSPDIEELSNHNSYYNLCNSKWGISQ